ncbi:MAG: MATE family efflux transporter [Alistipes sp.]|jgi:MATE family multidrug resistance protein|nr:MATE family efflux transporter [Alistipes sp.]
MNKEIFRIAVPNIISSITVPLMGIFSTAIAGHWGDPRQTIGALAVGVSIFNFIYWNCAFVRMGTSGFTAQAYGAGNFVETTAMLARAVVVSLFLGLAILLLQYPLGELSLWIMNGNSMVSDYFYARIWAVPAGIMLFGLNGWFTGMQNAVIPMTTSIAVNVVHVACSLWFVFGCDMGIVGIAYAAVVAQWCGMLLSVVLLIIFFRHTLRHIDIRAAFDLKPMKEFFRVNADIIIRTFCICMVYTFFTAASARMEDDTVLAVNTMLMQLFTLFSYMNDGFAYAAEALTGRFVGARDVVSLRRCLRRCVVWAMATALFCVAIYVGWWRDILALFTRDGANDAAQMIDVASRYVGWVIAIPLAAAMPFLMDGVMVGATLTRILRNSMLLSTAAYFAIYYALHPLIGNDALWLAFTLYMALRGVAQYFMSDRLRAVYRKAE